MVVRSAEDDYLSSDAPEFIPTNLRRVAIALRRSVPESLVYDANGDQLFPIGIEIGTPIDPNEKEMEVALIFDDKDWNKMIGVPVTASDEILNQQEFV